LIYTLTCTDTSDLIHWQCEFLEYTWSKYNQPGELVRLVASDPATPLPVHKHTKVIRTKFTNIHPETGDEYPPYNRLYSIYEWLLREKPHGTVLILDPDMIFRQSVSREVMPGSPRTVHWYDFGFRESDAELTTVDGSKFQPVTWPTLIHTDDLIRLIPLWIEFTAKIRQRTNGWESDMFAFVAASAELGITYTYDNICAWMPWPEDVVAGAPLIHFCQPFYDKDKNWIWGKYTYIPWERIPVANLADKDYCRELLYLIDEYAQLRTTSEEHADDTIFIAIAAYCESELVSTIESCLEKAMRPENLRFGICLQYDNNGGPEMQENCLNSYLVDERFRIIKYDYSQSQGGCWARNLVQEMYQGETYTLQVDSHTQLIEGWDAVLIQMVDNLPSAKPLITGFPALYTRDDCDQIILSHLQGLNTVATTIAESWSEEGWIHHPQNLIPENNTFPRRTRFISGAFVFTLGQWNDEVRQDPEHFYTGEEFALALRSYTQGYDLFDPSQIVLWHRSHPAPSRKYWDDNVESATLERHNKAITRLKLLMHGDPEHELGRYGLGEVRTLDDYRIFSGLDFQSYSVHPDAASGVPPDPVTLKSEYAGVTNKTLFKDRTPAPELVNECMLDLTVHLREMDPLELACKESNPVLLTLFKAMLNNQSANTPVNGEVIYLQIQDPYPKALYLNSSQIIAIETNPPVNSGLLEELIHVVPNTETKSWSRLSPVFDDSWKFWIWNNINRGCSRDGVFKHLIEAGFEYDQVSNELNYQPAIPLDKIESTLTVEAPNQEDYFIPNATRLKNEKIELYTVECFLNSDECEQLIDIMSRDLAPSTTVDSSKPEGIGQHESRTSQTSFFNKQYDPDNLAAEIRQRICKLMRINPDFCENIQGHMYNIGEEYQSHYDWFEPGSPEYETHASEERGGQRTWSVLVYLNDVERGGETRFVNLDENVTPQQGKIIIWNNLYPSGQPNPDVIHHALPAESGRKAVLSMWFRAKGKGEMVRYSPGEETINYTPAGFKKITLPRLLFKKLHHFYEQNKNATSGEPVNEYIQNISQGSSTEMIQLPRSLKIEISHALKPILEKWSKQPLESTAVYGIRRYLRGATLKMHRDRSETHIVSAILNIEQNVDQDWPLELEDNYYRRHKIMLRPGDMLLYESARLLHGRPGPFVGNEFSNIFVHYKIGSERSPTGNDITV